MGTVPSVLGKARSNPNPVSMLLPEHRLARAKRQESNLRARSSATEHLSPGGVFIDLQDPSGEASQISQPPAIQ